MKTATVRTYPIFGTRNGFCTDVLYRGRILYSFCIGTANEQHNQARQWAFNRGFTHTKTIFG
jgi:hypothetical protein